MTENKIVIIGAGLSGSLLAIYLAKRGFAVDVFEARGDMRKERMSAGRSINMALSNRGIAALREIGMDDFMLREAIPMHGRMIHTLAGETGLQPYSGRSGEYINSISRGGLNIALMNEAEKYADVRFHFDRQCVSVDCETGEATFNDGSQVKGDTLIATDGAGSAVRQAMERQLEHFQSSSEFLEHRYKELHIPPAKKALDVDTVAKVSGSDGFQLEKNALHIWPRRQFMMIALPNMDSSFTCTLFLANTGGNPAFDQLTDKEAVEDFFKREFPDAFELMPTLAEDFFANPTGLLGTVKCSPWNAGGNVLLLGDAAHAIVPFFGQGFNCAFEDVRVLASLIDKQNAETQKQGSLSEAPMLASGHVDWEEIYTEYGRLRKVNTDAIADMAVENFYEMRDRVADPVFQRKRQLETKLEQTFPDYYSKYSMVTFREDMPYSEAKKRGAAQDELLMDICSDIDDVKNINLQHVLNRIKNL